jgi:predicted nucleotide-binding protein
MPTKRKGPTPEKKPIKLLLPMGEATQKINDRISKGMDILSLPIRNTIELELAKKKYWTWNDYNREMLRRIFTNEELSEEYSYRIGITLINPDQSLGEKIKELQSDINSKIHRLSSIRERLELIPMDDSIDGSQKFKKETSPVGVNSKVFVVHGHDEAAREMVARFLEKIELEPIILHEQPNEGRTVIEKLEHNADVGFAVVLLTPDDEGRKKAEGEVLRDRARQNVLLELGYFINQLGRKNVCALHKGSVEIPTDYLGVIFVPLDEGGGWQLRLSKELKAAGFDIDLNKAM